MNADVNRDVEVLWTLVFQIITYAEKRLAAHMALYNLTPPQFFVLKTLTEHQGSCPIGQIAREHHLTNATLTGLINRLEAMQPPLVIRERSSDDRRSITVSLTDAGKERFWDIQRGIMEQAQVILSMLSQEEREDIIEKTSRYAKIVMEMFPVETYQGK